VFWPGTAGEVLKKNCIVAPPLVIIKLFAGIPFTVKSLASTFAGPGGLRLTMKSVGGLKTVVPQFGLVRAQPAEVGVGVGDGVQPPPGQSDGVGVTPGVAVGVIVIVAVAVGVGDGGNVAVAVAVVVGVGLGVGVPPEGIRNAYTLLSLATYMLPRAAMPLFHLRSPTINSLAPPPA